MKKLRVLLVSLAAALGSLVVASPAQAAVEPCWQGQVCFYVDKDYGGKPIWQESAPGYYSFTGSFRRTSSMINRTAYTLKLVGSNEFLSLCLIRGHAVRRLPEGYHDQLRSVEVAPSTPCTQTI